MKEKLGGHLETSQGQSTTTIQLMTAKTDIISHICNKTLAKTSL